MTSDFPINLLDFCSEIPELCKGEKIDSSNLIHMSMNEKDNLYLGFQWPKPFTLLEGYVQITLVTIEPSGSIVRVGNFPILSLGPKTNRLVAENTFTVPTHELATGVIEL
jgi:hypothetical protein